MPSRRRDREVQALDQGGGVTRGGDSGTRRTRVKTKPSKQAALDADLREANKLLSRELVMRRSQADEAETWHVTGTIVRNDKAYVEVQKVKTPAVLERPKFLVRHKEALFWLRMAEAGNPGADPETCVDTNYYTEDEDEAHRQGYSVQKNKEAEGDCFTAQAALAEQEQDGQFAVVAEVGVVRFDHATLTLFAAKREVLMHTTLESVKLGISDTKLIIISKHTSPTWLCEFVHPSAASKCLGKLRDSQSALDVRFLPSVEAADEPAMMDDHSMRQELDRLVGRPDFNQLLTTMRSALETREGQRHEEHRV